MSRLARLRRRLFTGAVVLGCLATVGLLAARWYLSSASAARLAQQRLSEALGEAVDVESAHIGLYGDSTLTGVTLRQPDGSAWLQAQQVVGDLALTGLVRGRRRPDTIAMRDVRLTLRFDRQGHLLTRLPTLAGAGGPLPQLTVRSASVTVEQEGRPPFTLGGIDLALVPGDGGATVTGSIDDPTWGTFDLEGRQDGTALTAGLSSRAARIMPEALRTLPLLPESLWRHVRLEGEGVGLSGRLSLTRRGGLSYRVEFGGLRVTLPQADRPTFTAHPVAAVLEGDGDGFTLRGGVRDPYWGDWDATARFFRRPGDVLVDLRTRADVAIDLAKLRTVPFVPPAVWEQVQGSGRTSARVRVRLAGGRPQVHYRVTLVPHLDRLHVRAIDLDAEYATGRVLVEGDRVWLEDVTGSAARGRLALNGELDFRGRATRLHFAVRADKLALNRLPPSWELPRQIEGNLTGEADLLVTVRDGRVTTTGHGEGRIEDARVVGFPTAEPIRLSLSSEDGRLQFRSQQPAVQSVLYLIGLSTLPAERPPHPLAPDRLATRAAGAVTTLAGHAVEAATALLDRVGRVEQMMRAKETTYLDANLNLQDVDLAELLARLEIDLPVRLQGRLSFQIQLGIPINDARDLRAYRLKGEARLLRARVGGVPLDAVAARIAYAGGVLRLDGLRGEVPAGGGVGTFAGGASAQVAPLGATVAELRFERLPADVVLRPIAGIEDVAGLVSGAASVSVPLKHLDDPAAYSGTATMQSPAVEAFGVEVRAAGANVVLRRGRLAVSDLSARAFGAAVSGSGGLTLKGDLPFRAELIGAGVDLAAAQPWVGGWRFGGKGTLSADVAGSLRPVKFAGTGRYRGADLRLNDARIDSLRFVAAFNQTDLSLKDIQARLYKGEVTGTAEVPLDGRREARVDLRVRDVDAQAVTAAVAELPLKLRGQVSGRVQAVVRGREVDGSINLSATSLLVQNIPTSQLTGRVTCKGGKASYRLEGKALGGTFSLTGELPPAQAPARKEGRLRQKGGGGPRAAGLVPAGMTPAARPALLPVGGPAADGPTGRFRLRDAQLSQLLAALGFAGLGDLSGRISIDLPFRADGPTGRGRFELTGVRRGDDELSPGLRGEVRLEDGVITLRDVNGSLAGGQLRLSAGYRWGAARGWFTLALSGAESSRLFGLVPGLKSSVRGPVAVSLRGTLGPECRGSGTITFTRAQVIGVRVDEWRVPIDFAFVPGQGRGELMARESAARVGQGQARVRATLHFNVGSTRLDGTAVFIDAHLASLAGLIGEFTTYARGRVSGRVDFASDNLRSANDVTASVQATLNDAQALQLPVLSALVPYVLPGRGMVAFRGGELRGRLAGGVFRIARLNLDSPIADLFIHGNITVQGRLDLDVVARTTSLGGKAILLLVLARRLPPVGPLPVQTVVRVSELLADRVLYLKVTGTTRSPVVRLLPLPLLTEEAVRYFLMRLLVPAP